MVTALLDLDLLHSFVSVVDAGGFTRASARVHRSQSTVSQQIRRLEEDIGRPLLNRDAKRVELTEEGERLLSYARRMLALASEARDVVTRAENHGVVRLGVTEDFGAHHLVKLLATFGRAHPGLRLDVRCGVSIDLLGELEGGELDLAIVKRDVGGSGGISSWPERLAWVTSAQQRIALDRDPVPLAVFGQGCLYRNRAIHALESAGRAWRIAYTSPNLAGIQAAVSVGLGISILPDIAVLATHRVLQRRDGFPPVANTELALLMADNASVSTRRLSEVLAKFCSAVTGREAARAVG
jgi:DNA-binding transcriptional LysR family regulator